jgi:hypothetical protein
MDMDYADCTSVVPFSQYDWSFERKGRLMWKYVPLSQTLSRLHADSIQSNRVLPHRILLRRRILDDSRVTRASLRDLQAPLWSIFLVNHHHDTRHHPSDYWVPSQGVRAFKPTNPNNDHL